jgi:hypothetical protein
MPVVAAGGTFAMTTLAGLVIGIWAGGRTGQGLWVLAGLFGGLAVGAYGAYRLLMRSL